MSALPTLKGILRFVLFYLMIFTGIALVGFRLGDSGLDPVSAAPEVFPGTLNGGCYLATPSTCKLRVDPFSINMAIGAQLEAFQLQSNGLTLYDFSTDVSNPPGGIYTPSTVKLDFAAVCSRTYVINLLADDSSHANFLNIGQTKEIACPEGRFDSFFPVITK